MMEKKIRVRFAPSPTGYLHLGNARTALFNWLFARKYRGRFILRIEDTDQERANPAFEKSLIEDLRWLGLHWDEGPQLGGDFAPYRQSQRRHYYLEAARKLLDEGKAYFCYCSGEELQAQRQRLLFAGRPPRYPGSCRRLSERQKRSYEKEGRKPSIRFKVQARQTIVVEDLLRGPVEVSPRDLGDFIIVRSNQVAAYNLAVVVDDALMKITHVIRGEDHLPNTPRQQLLYQALGYEPPHFVHLPMILGEDRSMLSKRHGARSLSRFRREGYLPQALVNYLALLGWSSGDGREIFSPEELVEAFSLSRLAKSAAVFDPRKLNWLNAHYLREMEIARLTPHCLPFLQEAGLLPEPPCAERLHWLQKVIDSVRPNLTRLADLPGCVQVYFRDDFSLCPRARRIAKEGKEVIEELAVKLENAPFDSLGEMEYEELMQQLKQATGLRGKRLFMPVRAALSGSLQGPELRHLFVLLGKEGCLRRIRNTLKALLAE